MEIIELFKQQFVFMRSCEFLEVLPQLRVVDGIVEYLAGDPILLEVNETIPVFIQVVEQFSWENGHIFSLAHQFLELLFHLFGRKFFEFQIFGEAKEPNTEYFEIAFAQRFTSGFAEMEWQFSKRLQFNLFELVFLQYVRLCRRFR